MVRALGKHEVASSRDLLLAWPALQDEVPAADNALSFIDLRLQKHRRLLHKYSAAVIDSESGPTRLPALCFRASLVGERCTVAHVAW